MTNINAEYCDYYDESNETGIMQGVCRYDVVLSYYSAYIWGPFNNLAEYRHGRSLIDLYELIPHDIGNDIEVAKLAQSIDELELFLGVQSNETIKDVMAALPHLFSKKNE